MSQPAGSAFATGGGTAAGPSAPKRGHVGGSKSSSGLPWIAPAILVSVGLIYYCIGYTGYISTLSWNGVSPTHQSVGFGNYKQLISDPVFWGCIRHTVLYFLITFGAQVILGIVFAAILHSKVWLRGVYKVVIFLPVVLASATMAPVFEEIFAPSGQLNQILSFFGLGSLTRPWLAQPTTALAVIIIIGIWQSTGVAFILYYAAMSQIDDEVIEAARIDGAGALRMLTSIVWPSVRGTTAALSVLSVISALKLFDIPNLVTNGGPDFGTEFLGTFIYRVSIPQAQVGYGAAISIVLLVLAVAVAIMLTVGFRVRYRSE